MLTGGAKNKNRLLYCCGFSGCLEGIDCTHIPIIAPAVDEYAYVNRKGFHSINVQAICNANLEFINVTARWPGGTHDSFILGHSHVGQRFSAGDCDGCWLLGDSGYGLKRWLLTPFSDLVTDAQKKT